MAYKFQLGAATLSGSLTQEGDITGTGDLAIQNSGEIGCADDPNLITLASASVAFASDADVNIAKTGGLQLGGVAVTSTAAELNLLDGVAGLVKPDFTKLADLDATASEINAVCDSSAGASHQEAIADGDFIMFRDGGITGASKFEAIADVAALFAGDGLTASNSVMAVNVDDSSIETNSDALRIKALGVTNAMLAGSIADSKLNAITTANKVALSALDIDGASPLGSAALDQADLFIFDDGAGGTNKKVTFSNLEDSIFDNVSGDATIAAGGALTIAANAVEGSMLNTNTAGDGITYAGNQLNVIAAQTIITSVKNDSLVVGRADGNDHIDFGTAGNIKLQTNNETRLSVQDSMVSSSVNLLVDGDISVTAGGGFDIISAGNLVIGQSVGDNNLTLAGTGSTVIIPGDLQVQGTTKTVDVEVVSTANGVIFEGATDDGFETTLKAVDSTADRTVQIANQSGFLIPFAAVSTTAISAIPDELNLLDGDVAVGGSITIAGTDGIIVDDGGTMKKVPASDLKGLVGSLEVAAKANLDTLEADKVNFFADLDANATVTLPESAASLIGKSVYIKAKNLTASAKIIVNTQASAQKIDGADSIELESPFAAVRLIYVAENDWRVF